MGICSNLFSRLIDSFDVVGLEIPTAFVKFYKHEQPLPREVTDQCPETLTLTCCQAERQASLDDAVLLTIDNIGCVAAAITLGLVDQYQDKPLTGPRIYTDLMQKQAGKDPAFRAPSPKEFSDGTVYACSNVGRREFCLFGREDVGRFNTLATAQKALGGMMSIQPPEIKGVFFYSASFDELDLSPDVVVMSLRPVELTRIIQACQFNSGERVTASMGPLRAVCSDLIARPFLTGQVNISPYCLGARLIAQFGADRLGIGMPFNVFETIVKGMEDSMTGYPFQHYPGASGSLR